jgi:hypothetical protein
MDNLERDYRHDRRLDWAYLGLRAFAILCGSGVIVTLALAAAHLADHGAVVPGLGMFGAATASIVGALVTYTRSGKR